MKTQKHTPTPWKTYRITEDFKYVRPDQFRIKGGKPIRTIAHILPFPDNSEQANMEFIVRAVNNHERLLEACKFALSQNDKEHMREEVCNKLWEAIKQAEAL